MLTIEVTRITPFYSTNQFLKSQIVVSLCHRNPETVTVMFLEISPSPSRHTHTRAYTNMHTHGRDNIIAFYFLKDHIEFKHL